MVVCLSETHVTENIYKSEIQIKGYKHVICLSNSRHTGGVLFYIKNNYKYTNIIYEIGELNCWFLGIKIIINCKPYIIITVYHSPNSSHMEFINKFENIMESSNFGNSTIIVVGDFNINVALNNFYKDKLIQSVNRIGLYQVMNQFTRITNNTSTIIDLLITNKKDITFKVHLTPRITDHCIISINLNATKNLTNDYKVIRDYKNFNELNFQLDLIKYEWKCDANINLMSDNFVYQILQTLNKHAPCKVIKERNLISKGWWNTEIKMQIQERDNLFKRATITKTANDWENYKKKRNEVVMTIRQKKSNYYMMKIDEAKDDSKEMWKTLKELLNGSKINGKNEIAFGDNIVDNEELISMEFNNFFINSITEIIEDLNKDYDNGNEDILENVTISSNYFEKFTTVTMCSLRKCIQNLPNKTSSTNGITTKILKSAFEIIGNRLLDVISTSLETGEVPKNWKVSTVVPIEKKPNTSNCNEYRPVNMLPSYEKVLELLVKDDLCNFIENNNILTNCQSGFRKNNSCETAIQSVLVQWKGVLNKKLYVGAIFLDFKRAFETINRPLLLEKLERMGFRGTVLKWFNSYLINRMQVCKYKNSVSEPREVLHGVPQGSVLGPILFILYLNDIVTYIKNSIARVEIQMFADDTLIYVTGNDIDVIIETLNEALEHICKWLTKNNLTLNTEKSKVMLLSNQFSTINNSNRHVEINQQKIQRVTEFKYLGVIIDQHLKFSSHANYVIKKVSKKVYFLCRISSFLSEWSKLLVYKTIIAPHFIYCPTILFMFNNSEFYSLQKIQNKALRSILNCNSYTSIRFMLEQVEILSVRQIIMLNVFIFLFKLLNNMLPTHLLEYCSFINDIHDYNTRNNQNFYVERSNTNYGQNHLFNKGLRLYNDLPQEIKNSSTIIMFKIKCTVYVRERWPV